MAKKDSIRLRRSAVPAHPGRRWNGSVRTRAHVRILTQSQPGRGGAELDRRGDRRGAEGERDDGRPRASGRRQRRTGHGAVAQDARAGVCTHAGWGAGGAPSRAHPTIEWHFAIADARIEFTHPSAAWFIWGGKSGDSLGQAA